MEPQVETYTRKLEALKDRTLLGLLDDTTQQFIRDVCVRYRMTFQEFRWLAEVARDLQMWQEPSLGEVWQLLDKPSEPAGIPLPQQKERMLHKLKAEIDSLRKRAKSYPGAGLPTPTRTPLNIALGNTDKQIVGACPVASEKTVCCNLKTIDATENCAFGCSYCTIQTFYGSDVVVDARLREKLANIEIDPQRFYHFGTGQASDSLVWGNRGGMLDALCGFAAKHPNVLVEFKTKSSNVTYFLAHPVPPNIVCSWSLNTETIICNEEHFTARLEDRLNAARRVADRGVKVAFHFHPIVFYDNWEAEYHDLALRVQERFQPHEVLFISFGSVTLIKPVIQAIRKRGEATRILQMDMVPDPHGKLSYPDEVKIMLFRSLHRAFGPWHASVYMYLCMERDFFWYQVFGRCYESNDAFEADFGAQIMEKLQAPQIPRRGAATRLER